MDGGAFGRALEATFVAVALISAVVGWCVIEGLIWLVKFLWAHLHWVSMVAVLCASCHAADASKKDEVIILHKGDPFPAPGVLYSYDSPETEKDFDRRRKEQEAKTIRKEDVTLNMPAQKTCLNG